MRKGKSLTPGRRVLALALCLALLCPLLGSPGFAEEADGGLCEHHPAHTADCGFSAGSPESPCTHVHDESCYAVLCVHEGEEGHVCSEESGCLTLACTHEHDESCGYAPEVPAAPCEFNCPVCAGEETPVPAGTPEPTEDPEPTETSEPTESPEPTEAPLPSESPEPTEEPEPSKEPALPVMALSGAELTDAESGELLWSWVPGEEPEEALWPLQGEQLLTLRVDCPAAPESEASRQLRLSLSPLLRLTGWEEAEGLSFSYGPLDEEGAPPVSGGELLCTLEPTVSSLELKLRLAADGEVWEARNAAAEEPGEESAEPLPEELLRAELLTGGEAPEEPALLLKGFLDPGVSLMALQVPYTKDTSGKNFANLVLFAYFQDDAEGAAYFQNTANVDKIISAYEGGHGRSFKNYMATISNGQFQVLNLFPQYDESRRTIQAVKLSYTRAQADRNIDSGIIDEAIRGLNIDPKCLDLSGGDGIIDNVTVVLYSPNDTASSQASIHPHKSNYPGTQQIAEKHIGAYNILNTYRLIGSTLASEGALIAHEFLHTLGYPDLYRSGANDFPVSYWDIMAGTSPYPSWPLAYLRYTFTHWIDLQAISSTQTLTLSAPGKGDPNRQAYILKSPLNEHELFVVEARQRTDNNAQKKDSLDAKISLYMDEGETGLIVYRVDTTVEGLSNYHGRTGIYVFRPQAGASDQQQAIQKAYLSPKSGRTSIGSADMNATLADGALTFSDGCNSGIVISAVQDTSDGTMSCKVTFPDAAKFDLWQDTQIPAPSSSSYAADFATSIVTFRGTPYVAAAMNNSFYTYRYDGAAWQPLGSPWAAGGKVMQARLAVFNDKLYLAYLSDKGIQLKQIDPATGSATDAGSKTGTYNEIELQAIGDGLYITYVDSDSSYQSHAGLLKFDGSRLAELGTFSGALNSVGQAQLAYAGGKLYVSYRNPNGNVVDVFRVDGTSFVKVSDGSIKGDTGLSYGLIALNDQLMIVVSVSGHVQVFRYAGGSKWTGGKQADLVCFEPKLTVVNGYLYMLTSPNTEEGFTYVYQYDADSDSWLVEGGRVDSQSSHITLTSDGEDLYVNYYRSQDNKLFVRKKSVSNTLLYISVTPPDKTEYTQGEPLSRVGMEVIAQFKRSYRALLESEYTLSGFDNSNTVGTHTATVSYGGKTAWFQYTVKAGPVKPPQPPAQPGLSGLTDTGSGLRFSWSAVSGANKYRVYVREGSGTWRVLGDTTATSYTWTPPRPGSYSFSVSAIAASGLEGSRHGSGLSIAYEPLKLTLTPPAGYGDAHIYIDGAEYPATKSGGSYSLTLPNAAGKTAVMYQYSGTVPVGMAVWRLSYQGTKVAAKELTGLRDLISYHGFSIRIQAPAGIRFKSGISEATRSRLLGGGVDGCRLLEYGTLFMTQGNRKTLPFVKGGTKVGGGRAYWSENGRVTDLIYERVSGRLRFTSVLINLAPDMYNVALAFRGYAILDQGGEQLIVYGPPVDRSVYKVAQQVMNAREFPPGSAGYSFVQNIINSVERR